MIKFRTHIQGKLNFTGIIFNILEMFSKTSCHPLQVMTFDCLWIIIRILIYSQIGTQLLLEWLLCVCNTGLTAGKEAVSLHWAFPGEERKAPWGTNSLLLKVCLPGNPQLFRITPKLDQVRIKLQINYSITYSKD